MSSLGTREPGGASSPAASSKQPLQPSSDADDPKSLRREAARTKAIHTSKVAIWAWRRSVPKLWRT
ncbi:hypothetical protein U9M48_011911 [Paspalum notatum var. saurae]|uniref:Uncharacterized protein n=1 Tax=Paspalum notatum var. saurae TaxID=547442 RepID=A0AAQ3SWG7_PASNO